MNLRTVNNQPIGHSFGQMDDTLADSKKVSTVVRNAIQVGVPSGQIQLSWNYFGDIGAEELAKHLKSLNPQSISRIAISWNNIGDLGVIKFVDSIKKLHNSTISEIDLKYNVIGDKGACALAEILDCSNLYITHLCLQHNQIRSEGAKALARAITKSNLVSIDLRNNNIGIGGATALAQALIHNISVTHLDLHGNNIDNPGAAALGDALLCNKSIRHIDLSDNDIGVTAPYDRYPDGQLSGPFVKVGAGGIINLAKALKSNSTVSQIDLSNNRIGNKGAIAFAEALEINTAIVSLDIRNNKIGDSGVIALARSLELNFTLSRVNISSNKISAVGLAALATTLSINPMINIIYDGNFNNKECLKKLDLDDIFLTKSSDEIVSHLRNGRRHSSSIDINRIRLVLLGSPSSGKTALVKRLRENKFDYDGTSASTEGVNVSVLPIDDIDFIVYDLSGQKEYQQTHRLFMNDKSIFMIVCSGPQDLLAMDDYLDIVGTIVSSASIIVATTFADGHQTSIDDVREKTATGVVRIESVAPVDSKSGRGIDVLRKILLEHALQNPFLNMKLPKTICDLIKYELDSLAERKTFSISAKKLLKKIALKFPRMQESAFYHAIQLFCDWGLLFQLSNGDLIINPQDLSDVLACIFSKKHTKLGGLSDGLLEHSTEQLSEIWGQYEPRLWSPNSTPIMTDDCSDDDETFQIDDIKDPPFLRLLHDCGFAYKLFNSRREDLHVSLIPALLPEQPFGFPTGAVVNVKTLSDYYFSCISRNTASLKYNPIHPLVNITFRTKLPESFLPKLQVRLKDLATLNGSWRYGCFLETTLHNENANKDNKFGCDDHLSYAIVYQNTKTNKDIVVLSTGANKRASDTVLREISTLCEELFSRQPILSVTIGDRLLSSDEVHRHIDLFGYIRTTNGGQISSNSGENLSLSFGKMKSRMRTHASRKVNPSRIDNTFEQTIPKHFKNFQRGKEEPSDRENREGKKIFEAASEYIGRPIPDEYKELRKLQKLIYDYDDKNDMEPKDGVLTQNLKAIILEEIVINIQEQFMKCIQEINCMLGLAKPDTQKPMTRKGNVRQFNSGIHTLWLPFIDSSKSVCLVPLTPLTSPLQKPRWEIVRSLKIPVIMRPQVPNEASNIVHSALDILDISYYSNWDWLPIAMVSSVDEVFDRVRNCEAENFILFDRLRGYWIHRDAEKKFPGMSVSQAVLSLDYSALPSSPSTELLGNPLIPMSLRNYIQSSKQFGDIRAKMWLIYSTATAMMQAHDTIGIHGDFTSQNVLLSNSDFVAYPFPNVSLLGARSAHYKELSDIKAFGVVACEILSQTISTTEQKATFDPSIITSDVPQPIVQLIQSCYNDKSVHAIECFKALHIALRDYGGFPLPRVENNFGGNEPIYSPFHVVWGSNAGYSFNSHEAICEEPGPRTLLSLDHVTVSSLRPIAWKFIVSGNPTWSIGVVPESNFHDTEYLFVRGIVGLSNQSLVGGVLTPASMHDRVITAILHPNSHFEILIQSQQDDETKTIVQKLPSDFITEMVWIRLGFCGFYDSKISLVGPHESEPNGKQTKGSPFSPKTISLPVRPLLIPQPPSSLHRSTVSPRAFQHNAVDGKDEDKGVIRNGDSVDQTGKKNNCIVQ